MRKLLLFVLITITNMGLVAAQEKAGLPRLSPLTQIYLQKAGGKPGIIDGYVYKRTANNRICISALVKTLPSVNEEALQDLGVIVGTKAGDVWTMQVPLEAIITFSKMPGLAYIQLDEPVFPLMDSVRAVTRVDSVQKGINLPAGFTGKDVVMGIIDVGFDYGHPLFFDTTGTGFRIRKVWEQKSAGTPPTGFAYGREITDSTAMWAAGTDIVSQSHGTHVAGIAAGSGYNGGSNTFRGVAFATDIVLVGITPPPEQWQRTGMTDIIDGMNYIYTYAASVNKAAVVNLSWGCTIGPHDGMSLFSVAVDRLTGRGKLFACSAGNTGGNNIHLGKNFTATDTVVHTFINFSTGLSERKTWIDIWGDSSKSFCASITLYNGITAGSTTGFICLDNALQRRYLVASTGDTCFIDFTTSTAEFNGKPRIFLNIYNKSGNRVLLSVKSTNARVNVWHGFVENSTGYYGSLSNGSQAWATNGNTEMTVSDWSTTKSAIPVAAFIAKNAYLNISSTFIDMRRTDTLGKLTSFSSRGPSADGRIRPFIAAPGYLVGSGVSSYDASFVPAGGGYSSVVSVYAKNGRNYPYAMLSGTSMSSPVVSGILALMLEADKNLTPQQAQDILAATAIQDAFTGVLPAAGVNTWGHGKVNAYAAIKHVLQHVSVDKVVNSTLSWSLFPNPSNGRINVISTAGKVDHALLQVVDISGKMVVQQNWALKQGINQTHIDLSGFPGGLYLVKMITGSGQSTVKVILE
jgi:minor extracellular serine protease Vpr